MVMNVTATNATHNTYVSVYPYGASRPNTSNLNVTAGRPVANLVVPVKDGKITLYNHAGSTDLIGDVQGVLRTLSPHRLCNQHQHQHQLRRRRPSRP
ncbi:hypothetical protein [Streptomyces sp. NPDC053755]|uniref:hypothetical protein n=1 Tax=Streptomyces sp. NPDC053755 TaxID=3155815 RepID=UPI00342BFEAD